jgi:hypothetical protein
MRSCSWFFFFPVMVGGFWFRGCCLCFWSSVRRRALRYPPCVVVVVVVVVAYIQKHIWMRFEAGAKQIGSAEASAGTAPLSIRDIYISLHAVPAH